MKKLVLGVVTFACLSAPVLAQEAPPPHKAPRMPVNRESLIDRRAAQMRDVVGQATILDGEKLRIADQDFRLFGVVPPQLSANYGPQARAMLDALTASSNTSCHIHDRDHDGHLLASCRTASGADLGLELLRRGLAVAARGSLTDTEFAQPYLAAEQAAQAQRLGLWSGVTPAAAPAATPVAPAAAVEAKKEEPRKEETKKDDAAKVEAAKAETAKIEAAKAEAAKTAATAAAPVPVVVTASHDAANDTAPGFFARYQILIASLLMLSTALSVLGTMVFQRRQERREELKALAAALRGELLAARAVCHTRLKGLLTEEDDRAMTWPRLRSTLYQAYVGRIGWLGAELARQIASIYGQSSDYAAYYNVGDDEKTTLTPKRQALQTLISHIEEVLPRLNHIEVTGAHIKKTVPVATLSYRAPSAPAGARVAAPAKRQIAAPVALVAEPVVTEAVPHAQPQPQVTVATSDVAAEAAPETVVMHHVVEVDATPHEKEGSVEAKDAGGATSPAQPVTSHAPTKVTPADTAVAALAETVSASIATVASSVALSASEASTEPVVAAHEPAEGTPAKSPVALWHSLRRFAREHFVENSTTANDDIMPDYAALIEQDIANMSFGDLESDTFSDEPRKTGMR